MRTPHLDLRGIGKSFPGVRALSDVSCSIAHGEIHALCGENGAGKSTLIKILSGVYPHGSYEGEFRVDGNTASFRNTRDAERAGITVIYQELALVPHMTVAENMFLGSEPHWGGFLDTRQLYHDAARVLEEFGLHIDIHRRVRALGIGEQQLVEIAKALSKRSQLLILDEPSAALTEEETATLLEILRGLRRRGVTCIYITHKLREIQGLADRVTVLRDGCFVATREAAGLSEHELIAMMVGRELTEFYPHIPYSPGETALTVRNLTVHHPERGRPAILENISFDVRAGEILGIAGLMGSGRTELLMSIFGTPPGRVQGTVTIGGSQQEILSPGDALNSGLALVSEDRKRFGLVLQDSVRHNLGLSSVRRFSRAGLLSQRREKELCTSVANDVSLTAPHIDVGVNTLSGGNQQKVVLGKWLLTNPRILFLDEPTRGIDVGGKYEIYRLMSTLVGRGVAIVMVSSEMQEILGMSHRIIVLHEGTLSAEFSRGEATQERIMLAATGHHASGSPVPS
jgi:D-xylose transport system ATP-binding protein